VVESGVVAGVFFAVAVSVIPTLAPLPPGQYIVLHRALGKGYHPVMPIITNSGFVLDVVAAVLADGIAQRTLFVAGAVLFQAVQAVSHLCNVPINRRVKAVDADAVPADWADPRPLWRNWHLVRTVFAGLLLLVNASALALG
jgi:uncharacterized membrane protein